MIILLWILAWFGSGILAACVWGFNAWMIEDKSETYDISKCQIIRIMMLLGFIGLGVGLFIFIIIMIAAFVCWGRPRGMFDGDDYW